MFGRCALSITFIRYSPISACARWTSTASGPSPSWHAARSPALAARSRIGRRIAERARADRQRAALQAMRGGGQRGEVARRHRRLDVAAGLRRRQAELAQKVLPRRLVALQPGIEHRRVDGRRRAVAAPQPALQGGAQARPGRPAWRDSRPCRPRGSARPRPPWRWPSPPRSACAAGRSARSRRRISAVISKPSICGMCTSAKTMA